jgi:hypothetical protein
MIPTRSSGLVQYSVKRTRTGFGDQSFSSCAPLLWNSLPQRLKQSKNVGIFKRRLEMWLFNDYFGGVALWSVFGKALYKCIFINIIIIIFFPFRWSNSLNRHQGFLYISLALLYHLCCLLCCCLSFYWTRSVSISWQLCDFSVCEIPLDFEGIIVKYILACLPLRCNKIFLKQQRNFRIWKTIFVIYQ